MQWYERLDEKIRDYLPDMTVERDVPMSRHTSFRIGGPARRLAFPANREQLVILLGLWFIRGPKDKPPIDDEIPPFAPPASSRFCWAGAPICWCRTGGLTPWSSKRRSA